MHAADYPGSHVVIRNANKKELPQRTLVEAAQLAAFYSQGKKQPKAAVHYTLKKYVNKPKGAAPGLVRLASFKTILVEPKIGDVKPITR
jgi:predicted ribosome quality control (RQC) complex YloA/Tae2 family protein